MLKSIIFLLLLFSIDSVSEHPINTNMCEFTSGIRTHNEIDKEPYTIEFDVKEVQNNQYQLLVTVALEEGSFFVSPHSKGDFSGQYKILLDNNKYFAMEKTFIETPRSVEKFDPHPFVNGLVNWVRETTSYEYQLNLMSNDNFEVEGLVQFVIEPRCTMEKIKFKLSYEKGKMKIKKIS